MVGVESGLQNWPKQNKVRLPATEDELGAQENRKEPAKHAKHAKRQGNFTFASFRVFSGQFFKETFLSS